MSYFEEADKKIVKEIQKITGAQIDGYFGPQSLLFLLIHLGGLKNVLPLSYKMYKGYAMFQDPEKVELIECKGCDVKDFELAGSGAFQFKNKVVSLLINDGVVINETTSKTWREKRVSCLYYTYSGNYGIKKVFTASELPNDVKWAISGVGLVSNVPNFYHPDWEGFSGKFADVLRKTHHVVLGFRHDGTVVYFLQPNCTMERLRWLAKEVYDLKFAISLDGGHIPAIQTDKFSFNRYQNQNNVVVFKR